MKQILAIVMMLLTIGMVSAATDEIFIQGILRNATTGALYNGSIAIAINFSNADGLVYTQTKAAQAITGGVYHVTFTGLDKTDRQQLMLSSSFILKFGSDIFSIQSLIPTPLAHAAFEANNTQYLNDLPASSYTTIASAWTKANDSAALASYGLYNDANTTSVRSSIVNNITTHATTKHGNTTAEIISSMTGVIGGISNLSMAVVAGSNGNWSQDAANVRVSIVNNITAHATTKHGNTTQEIINAINNSQVTINCSKIMFTDGTLGASAICDGADATGGGSAASLPGDQVYIYNTTAYNFNETKLNLTFDTRFAYLYSLSGAWGLINMSNYPTGPNLQTNITAANTSLKSYSDTTFLPKSGGNMAGNLNMTTFNITSSGGYKMYSNATHNILDLGSLKIIGVIT
jgi:hypothetical protein